MHGVSLATDGNIGIITVDNPPVNAIRRQRATPHSSRKLHPAFPIEKWVYNPR